MQPATAEYNVHDFMPNSQREADKGLLVKFFVKPRQDSGATKREGRPIFRDVEYIDIKVPGNRNTAACRPATEDDKQRFSDHYRAFKDRTENEMDTGTPLIEWPVMSRSMAEELAFFNVKTVEQLCTMADTQASKFMGLFSIRDKARLWLANAEKEKPMWEMDQKIRDQRKEINELQASIKKLMAMMEGVDVDEDDGDLNDKQKQRKRERFVKDVKQQVA